MKTLSFDEEASLLVKPITFGWLDQSSIHLEVRIMTVSHNMENFIYIFVSKEHTNYMASHKIQTPNHHKKIFKASS